MNDGALFEVRMSLVWQRREIGEVITLMN